MNNQNHPKTIQQNKADYIGGIALQVVMALASDKTPDAVKDCLKTIIFKASAEAGYTISDFSLIGESLLNVIEKLPVAYGRGFLHSIAAIIRHNTPAFQEFYDKRLDETTAAQPVENDKKDEIKLNRDEIIKYEEIELLIYSLVADAEFAPYAVYGLMFLFGSIKKLFEADNKYDIESIFTTALIKLYSLSDNVYEAINRVIKDIHLHYRAADFKNDDYHKVVAPFVESEYGEPNILDLSAQNDESEPLNSLAASISDILKNPNLPTRLYNVLTDELAEIYVDTNAPENILLNLKRQLKNEKAVE